MKILRKVGYSTIVKEFIITNYSFVLGKGSCHVCGRQVDKSVFPLCEPCLSDRIEAVIDQGAFDRHYNELERKWNKKPTPSCVYLMQMENTNKYKIGISNNVDQRRQNIQSSTPIRVDIVCFKIRDDAKILERALHRQYQKSRLEGEWFQLTSNEVMAIQEIIKNAPEQDY